MFTSIVAAAALSATASVAATSATPAATDTVGSAPATTAAATNRYAPPDWFAGLQLVVTATRNPEDPYRVPTPVDVVNTAELARQPADQTPDLLLGRAGILVQRTNYGGGSPFLRGLTGKQVLLLVDGVRLNNSLYRFGPHQYLNTVDPAILERIEVVHGPGSVLYGTDALGGVIHMFTRTPTRYADDLPFGPGVMLGGATYDKSLRGRLQVRGAARGVGLLAGVGGRHFDDVHGGGSLGRQAYTGYDEFSGDLKLTYTLGDRWNLIAATQLDRQLEVPKTSEIVLDGKLKYNYEPQFRALTYLQAVGRDVGAVVFDDAHLSFSYQAHIEGEQVIRDAISPETHERNDAFTPGAFAHLSKRLPRDNELSYGFEVYRDNIRSWRREILGGGETRTITPAFPDDAKYLSLGVYVQDSWWLSDWLRLLAGGRYSHFTASGTLTDSAGNNVELDLNVGDLTGSGAVLVELVPGLAIFGQVARGFRAPNMEDFFGKVDFASEIPNENLKPETSLDYSGGLKLRRGWASGQAFYFRSNYEDLIDRADVVADVDGDGVTEVVAQRQNLASARIQGVVLALELNPYQPLLLTTTYAWTRGDALDAAGNATGPLRRIPPQQGSVGLRWQWPQGHFVGADMVWADKQDRLSSGDIRDARIGPNGTPGYAVLNLRGGIAAGEYGFFKLGLENLTDKRYKPHGSGVYSPGRGAYVEYGFGL